MAQRPEPRTDFAWPIYANATLAGSAVLFPIPLVDWWLEERFRRRMLPSIAQQRGQSLSPAARATIDAGQRGCVMSGIVFLARLPLELLKRLSRKILYILTIKEATEKVSYYWQRAFLLDYMLTAGHLADAESARRARDAMERVLDSTPSPLTSLAEQILRRVRQRLPGARRTSRQAVEAAAADQQDFLAQRWSAYAGFLRGLAERYHDAYEATQGQG